MDGWAHVEGGKVVLCELECRCLLWNFIPYVWEWELSQIPIEWRVIDTNIHSHLNVPGDPWWLPVNYGEIFGANWVSCRKPMVVYTGLALRCSLTCSQRFCQIPLYIHLDSWQRGIWICVWPHSFLVCCPCP